MAIHSFSEYVEPCEAEVTPGDPVDPPQRHPRPAGGAGDRRRAQGRRRRPRAPRRGPGGQPAPRVNAARAAAPRFLGSSTPSRMRTRSTPRASASAGDRGVKGVRGRPASVLTEHSGAETLLSWCITARTPRVLGPARRMRHVLLDGEERRLGARQPRSASGALPCQVAGSALAQDLVEQDGGGGGGVEGEAGGGQRSGSSTPRCGGVPCYRTCRATSCCTRR
jgi:hypothetical protein